MSEILAVFLGAILAGGLQALAAYCDRKREDQSILVSIASEVKAICDLIRIRRYESEIIALIEHVVADRDNVAGMVIDLRSDYFQVFHSLSSNIGRMKPEHAAKIVRFYMNCKAIIDSTRLDGPGQCGYDNADARREFDLILQLIRDSLLLGDQIVQMPKTSLASSHHD